MIIFEYCRFTAGGKEESFRLWLDALDSDHRGRVIQRLITMGQNSPADFTSFIDGGAKEGPKKRRGIYKMQIGKKISYRPLLCRGLHGRCHVTMLLGTKEHDGKMEPSPDIAVDRKKAIEKDADLQRLLRASHPKTKKWLNEPVN